MPTRRLLLQSAAALCLSSAAAAHPRHAVRKPPAPPPAPRKDIAKPTVEDDQAGSPADTPLGPMDTSAQWAFITDFNTGATLLSKAANVEMPPSSMTKLMTAYVVYSHLKDGSLRLDQTLPVSEKAWRTQGSKMFVELGANIPVEDLIRGMIIQSGNDACIVLAEGIAGSEDQFVEMMNATARKLGLAHSHFVNCTGLPDPGHYMSVHDIATLARDLITNFPQYYHYDSEKTYTYHGILQYNRNPLVQRGIGDGLKTGHTDAGGYGVVGSALRNGRRVILVLNGMPTMRAREEESVRLMEWAFASFEDVTLFAANAVVETAPVYLGTSPSVPLVSGETLTLTMPRAWRQNAKITLDYDSPIPAPISRGDAIGTLTVTGQGVPSASIKLLAGEDVPRLGLSGRAMAVMEHFLAGA